jgi:type I restriction enzyme S subunit
MSVRSKPNQEGKILAETQRDGKELPDGWTFSNLGDLAAFINGDRGKNYPSKEALIETGIPFINAGHLRDGVIDSTEMNYISEERFRLLGSGKIESDDILYCLRGSLGKAAIVRGLDRGAIASSLVIIRPIEQGLSQFLYYFLVSPLGKDEILKYDNGSAQPNLSAKSVQEYVVPIPPLAELRRIVGKLELLLGKVSSSQQRLSRVPGLLKRFRQSVLAAACSGKLTADWRKKNPKTQAYETDVPTDAGDHDDELPSNWLQTTLGPLIELVTSGSRGWAKYYADSGCLFIRAQNINSDVLRLDDVAFVRLPNKAEGLRTRVQKDDILVTITGANVTKSALVDCNLDDAYVSQHVALVRLTDRRLAPFLFHWIVSTAHGRKQLLESAYGQGKPGLNLDNIRDVAIAIPPLAEQQEIVRRVEKLFAFAEQIEARLKLAQSHVDRITQSLLAKAFRGELVPTEHSLASVEGRDYETASDLLERIS